MLLSQQKHGGRKQVETKEDEVPFADQVLRGFERSETSKVRQSENGQAFNLMYFYLRFTRGIVTLKNKNTKYISLHIKWQEKTIRSFERDVRGKCRVLLLITG